MKINAQLIIKLRTDKSWTQEELAIASGLNLRTIQRIEKEASASLQSRKTLASVLDVSVQDLEYHCGRFRSCPECNSEKLYQCIEYVDTATIGGDMLPDLSASTFSAAKVLPVICGECGYVRHFLSPEGLDKLKVSKLWTLV